MSVKLEEFVKGIVAASVSGKSVKILRGVWGKVIEPQPGKAGTWRMKDGEYQVEVTKMGPVYGYLRVQMGGCVAEGLLVYRQPFVVYKPQASKGCEEVKLELKARGVEVYAEEEEE